MKTKMINIDVTTDVTIDGSGPITDEQLEAIKTKNEQLKQELKHFIDKIINDNNPDDAYDRAMKGL